MIVDNSLKNMLLSKKSNKSKQLYFNCKGWRNVSCSVYTKHLYLRCIFNLWHKHAEDSEIQLMLEKISEMKGDKMKKRLLALVMAGVMLLAAGCSGDSSNGGDAGVAQASGPVKFRLNASLSSLDWEHTTNTRDVKVWNQMYEGLYGMDEANNGYYKELAKDVAISDDQLKYTITLQDGVKFQNGEDLQASDVVFSYNRAMKNSRFNYITSMIDKVEALDEHTVLMTLNKPYAPIDHTFFSIKILNEKEVTEQGDQFGTIPNKAGTGAYYVTEYNVATGVKLTAFEDYWQGAPVIQDVEYIVISDDAAAVIAYENGELDYFEDAPLSEWDSLSAAAGDNQTLIKGNNIMFMAVNPESPNTALADLKVRQAIFYAIDKEDINLAVSDGYGSEAIHYMPPEYVATSPEDGFETYGYDPEKAKTLLAEAGYEGGLNVGTILTYGAASSNNAKMAQVLQANLAEVGIQAEVSVMEAAVVTPKLYAQDYDICVFADSGNYDFNNIRQQLHSESVGMYVVNYKDSGFDWERMEELIDLGASTSSTEERVAYYQELWAMVMDTATILPGIHRPVAIVWSDRLDIGDPVPTYYKIRTFNLKEEA